MAWLKGAENTATGKTCRESSSKNNLVKKHYWICAQKRLNIKPQNILFWQFSAVVFQARVKDILSSRENVLKFLQKPCAQIKFHRI